MVMPSAIQDLIKECFMPLPSSRRSSSASATLFLLYDSHSRYHRLIPFYSSSNDLVTAAPPSLRQHVMTSNSDKIMAADSLTPDDIALISLKSVTDSVDPPPSPIGLMPTLSPVAVVLASTMKTLHHLALSSSPESQPPTIDSPKTLH